MYNISLAYFKNYIYNYLTVTNKTMHFYLYYYNAISKNHT